jgi:hypothetical protein
VSSRKFELIQKNTILIHSNKFCQLNQTKRCNLIARLENAVADCLLSMPGGEIGIFQAYFRAEEHWFPK